VPFSYEFVSDRELVVVTASGPIDFDSGLALGEAIPKEQFHSPARPVLVDLREMDFVPETPDIHSFARELPRLRTHFSGPIAVVTTPGLSFGLARMTCLLAEAAGFPMSAFDDVSAAHEWLGEQRDVAV